MTGGEILGYFKNGQFWGFGGGAPDCRRLSGVQGPQAPAGVKGAELDHTHARNARARLAPQISKLIWDLARSRVFVGEIIATQRRATPTQRHAKHGSTLKEKLAFLSGTMDFHKPNGSEQIQFFPAEHP